MKRILICAAAAIVALASCSKTQVVYNDAPEEIGFKAVTGVMTKAALDSDITLGVFAEHNSGTPVTTNSYFDNILFADTDDDNVWSGSQYWPIQGTLDFTFYAPHISSGTVPTYDNATKTLAITIPNNHSGQIDYLYGTTRPMGQTKDGGHVSVTLKHALAMVKVTIAATKENVYTVKSIKLNNTIQDGTINVQYADDGTINALTTPTIGSPSVDYLKEFVATPVSLSTTDKTSLDAFYYVFPNTTPTSFTITYNIAGGTGDLTGTVPLGTGTWESGKQYVYNLTLTANEILVSPEVVDNWDAGDVDATYPII